MLTPDERSDLDALRSHYPTARAASVTVLKWFQERRGWISDESLHDAAAYLGLPAADLEGLATFYNLLYRKPVGEHVILLCDSGPCWICGYERIRRHLEERLGIRMGETTADGDFTLLPIVCLGDCDRAPTLMVGKDLHRDLTPDKVDRILDGYRSGAPPPDEALQLSVARRGGAGPGPADPGFAGDDRAVSGPNGTSAEGDAGSAGRDNGREPGEGDRG